MKPILAVAVLGTALLIAQTPPPNTDIFTTTVRYSRDAATFGSLTNITNRPEYDNQPAFPGDGTSILYTSIRNGAPTDIYRYVIATRKDEPLTKTTEGEYSATLMPDGKFFSVIRVEADQKQRLWKFPLTGGIPSLVFAEIQPVGYQAWLDANVAALFVLGTPPTLQIADVRTGKAETVASGIGRSLHKVPGRSVASFVHKETPTEWFIRTYDPQRKATETLVRTPARSEDFVWIPDGRILMGQGSRLVMWSPGSSGWREVADFSESVTEITRLAVSPMGDRIAIVAVPR